MNKFYSSIQCVILVGGLGSRLGSLTKDTPKPLVKVLGKPFLGYLINQLSNQGFQKIVLLTGYQADKINFFLSEFCVNSELSIKCISEQFPLGTGGAIRAASKHLEDRFLLLNGDTYLSVDYKSLICQFYNSQCEYMVGHKGPAYDEPCNITAGRNLEVISYGHFSQEATHVDCGVYFFSKKYFEKNFRKNNFGLSLVYEDMIKDGKLHLVETPASYYDIGTPQRLERFEEFLKGNNESS